MSSLQTKDPRDLFSVDAANGTITIQTDPELATDLFYVLSILLDLSKHMRAKVSHARAYEAANDQQEIKRRQNEFEQRSSEIFKRFQEHLNNGCLGDKAKALQCIKQDFSLGYGVAKIYITEGRRKLKAENKTQKLNK